MQFNVNEGVVKMLEVLASNKSLQLFIIVVTVLIRLPEIIAALKL